MEIRPLIVGSLMGPSSSPSFRQGPGGHIPFSKLPAIELYRDGLLAQSRNSSLRAVTCLSRSSPVCPGCHQSFPVVTRSIPECQMANASVKYLETPTTERTDRESSEECPRHRTFRHKLLTFSGVGHTRLIRRVSLSVITFLNLQSSLTYIYIYIYIALH